MKGYWGISGYIWEYIWKHMALIVAYGTIHMERRIDGNANVDICVIYGVNKDMRE